MAAPPLPATVSWLLGALLIYLVSPAVRARGFYLAEWFDAGAPLREAGALRWIALTGALAGALCWRHLRPVHVLAGIIAASLALCAWRLATSTGGLPLYRDDHPSMMYRLWLFTQCFPQTVNYSPLWNGGVLDSTPVSSGIQGVGLLLWPLWKSLPIHAAYTPGIGLLYIVVLPALAALAARLAGGTWTAAGVAAMLGLGISRHFFLWALHFGTVGASLAGAFLMPAAAALYRAIVLGRREWWLGPLLTGSIYFTVQWPPGALMLACVGLGALACWRRWSWRLAAFLAACGIAALALDIGALRAILDKGSSPLGFAMQHTTAGSVPEAAPAAGTALAAGAAKLGAHAIEAHPLLVFLGFGGAFLAGPLAGRRFFAPALAAFAALGAWGPELLPNLQLERMALPGLFTAVIPASLVAGRVLEQTGRRSLPARAALLALLALGGVALSRIHGNRTSAPYVTLNDQVRRLATLIGDRQPAGGRVLFAGATVHAVGRGHVAYLPVLAGAEMMACDYYHFPPKMVEYNYPPRAFRTNDADLVHFLDAYDVTHLVTFRRDWKRYLGERPDTFEKVGEVDDLAVYRAARAPSRFMRGTGRVRATPNRIEVDLDDAQAEAVIKYNWLPGLRAEAPATIHPAEALPGIQLIGIRPGGTNRVVITYRR